MLFLNIWKCVCQKQKHTVIYFDYGTKVLEAYYPQYKPQVNNILKLKGILLKAQ